MDATQLSLFDYFPEPVDEQRLIGRIRQREQELGQAILDRKLRPDPKPDIPLYPHRPWWWINYLREQREAFLRQLTDSDPSLLPHDDYVLYCKLWGIAPEDDKEASTRKGVLNGNQELVTGS